MHTRFLLLALVGAAAGSSPALADPYYAVLAGQQPGWTSATQDDLWNEVLSAMGTYVASNRVTLPLGPKGKLEKVRQVFLRGELDVRHGANGATEVIGDADFIGDPIPNRYVGDHEVRPFRVTFDARGKLVAFSYQAVDNTQLAVTRPSFERVTAPRAQQITDGLVAFYKSRNPTGDNLESALAGNSAKAGATVVEVQATTADFGDFGTIARVTTQLRPKPGSDGSSLTYVLEVASDKAGKVVSVGAVW